MDAGGDQTSNNSYGYGIPKLPSYPSPIPLSALDKFLNHSSSSTPQFAPTLEDQKREMRNAFGEFSPFSSSSSSFIHADGGSHQSAAAGGYGGPFAQPPTSFSYEWLLPMLQDNSNYSNSYYLSFDEEDEQLFQGGVGGGGVIDFNDQEQQQQHGFMGSAANQDLGGKRGRVGSPSAFLIKGQWTEEEDSALIELVEDHGLRKWALIAEKLLGRTGKQCRERWQNHLRPDIKKDSWTEEEEMVLVQAHQLFGNKWAEIAKQIPGRTENSIKNHWNATKRRQNSKRKSKKVDVKSGKPKSCVLQDYIKKLMNATLSEDLSDNESSSLLDYGCDDEILFMQKIFKEVNMNNPITPQVVTYDDQVNSVAVVNNPSAYQMTQATTEQEVVMDAEPKQLSSDLYMAQLLEGAGYFDSSPFSFSTNEEFNFNYDEFNEDDMDIENHNIYQGSKDLDLMEMVYAATLPNQPFGSPLWG
ncbi:hypothetical protein V2J09_019086 [Rumex salicifolius]